MSRIICSARRFIRNRPFPFVTFFIAGPGISMVVDALIDTGSPFTCLAPKDLINTGVPFTRMRGETIHLAGHKFINVQIKGAVLSFRTDTGGLYNVEPPSIGGLVPTKRNATTLREVEHIPSIIGNDFLEDHKLALHFDPSEETVYLDFP